MKLMRAVILVLMTLNVCYAGGLKIPSNVFTINELEAAKAKAEEKGMPVAFLYTNAESDCPLCNDASKVIIKELKSSTVLVYVRSKSEMPKNVSKLVGSRGKYIPKVAVYDSAIETELGLVVYGEIKAKGKKAFKEMKADIRAYRKAAKS